MDGTGGLADAMERTTRSRLSRFQGRLTRGKLNFSDETAGRETANDKRCAIEARVAGAIPSWLPTKALSWTSRP